MEENVQFLNEHDLCFKIFIAYNNNNTTGNSNVMADNIYLSNKY